MDAFKGFNDLKSLMNARSTNANLSLCKDQPMTVKSWQEKVSNPNTCGLEDQSQLPAHVDLDVRLRTVFK